MLLASRRCVSDVKKDLAFSGDEERQEVAEAVGLSYAVVNRVQHWSECVGCLPFLHQMHIHRFEIQHLFCQFSAQLSALSANSAALLLLYSWLHAASVETAHPCGKALPFSRCKNIFLRSIATRIEKTKNKEAVHPHCIESYHTIRAVSLSNRTFLPVSFCLILSLSVRGFEA